MPFRKLKESGSLQSDDSLIRTALGLGSGFLIYMFIFLYGVMVMRGVMEEKTNRIVEIIISSVKPFQLMMGKIVGIALVGLTQFIIWALLSGLAMGIVGAAFAPDALEQARQGTLQTQAEVGGINTGEVLAMIAGINWAVIIGSFIFFFLGGYLLYSSLLAAIGAAVDAETDTQQFMLPISLPLAFSLVISMNIIKNPDGPWATFFSIFPLTSPIVMMSRIPFNPPAWQVLLSMALLIVGFFLSTWMAGKIYRTGILMYGKKATYRELAKWLFYKGNS
jgi:ABC-2 type transport system permease protein